MLGAIAVGRARPRWAPWTAGTSALVVAGLMCVIWASGDRPILDEPWSSVLGSRLVLTFDALAAPLVVFATALAAPILIFSARYLPSYLARRDLPHGDQARFAALMLAFMTAMVLLLIAQDLIVMFLALELTAFASFLLIEFDREDPAARRASKTALVITVGSSLVFLLGALLIAAEHQTTVLAELRDRHVSALAATCLALGVLAKSAQVPLHFWLPRAMVAPAPVSAYLHSATLVAAGVFALQRLHILLAGTPLLLEALQYVGLVSILVGSALALVSDGLKRILAYSTIAQYGYAVVMLGAGGAEGLVGAAFFIVAHGVCKCALFLTAGAVTSTTGSTTLSTCGGLGRSMPLVAAASAVAAFGLAGAPLTIGYFKDELFFAATAKHGWVWIALATAAPALTITYVARFWLGIFAGRPAREARRADPFLVVPIVALAVLVVAGGLWLGPLARAFNAAGGVIAGRSVAAPMRYHLDARAETWMALAAWAIGLLLAITRPRWQRGIGRITLFAARHLGPARLAERTAGWIGSVSDRLHGMELRDLRDRITVLLVCTAVLVLLGLIGSTQLSESLGAIELADAPILAALAVTAGAALGVGRPTQHVATVLLLSFVGFSMALTFALAGAPNLSLVIVVIESLLSLLFFAALWQLRVRSIERTRKKADAQRLRHRIPWPGLIAGAVAFFLAWLAQTSPRHPTVADQHVRLAPQAHARDVVTAILADFRGLDTAGELTVLAVGILGAAAIWWGRANDRRGRVTGERGTGT